jgi:GWxTD domain-containing protein
VCRPLQSLRGFRGVAYSSLPWHLAAELLLASPPVGAFAAVAEHGLPQRTSAITQAEKEQAETSFYLQWLNPGTPKNEFKQEHYRRIAHANKHFGASARQGWQTDRGHMYIVYGPPDTLMVRIEKKSPAKPPPFEVWTYRHLEGIGESVSVTFIERTGTGDYTLAPGSVP